MSIGEESWILTLVKDILERFGYSVIGVGQRGKKKYILVGDNINEQVVFSVEGDDVIITSDVTDFSMVRR